MSEQLTAIHIRSGEGPATWAMGQLFEHLLTGEEGGGLVGLSVVTAPSGAAPPLHRHTKEAEAFFLLDGAMTYRAGDDVLRLQSGDFLWLPRGLPHAFRITGGQPARFLALTAPGGLLHMYDEVGVPAAERRLPGSDGQPLATEVPRWLQLAAEYGIEVLGPPLAEEAV